MNESGINKMKELNADLNDLTSGFNWPPLNTISHLHQHFISPASNMSFFRKILFSSKNFYFVDVRHSNFKLIQNFNFYIQGGIYFKTNKKIIFFLSRLLFKLKKFFF